jgi:hypothetical protein
MGSEGSNPVGLPRDAHHLAPRACDFDFVGRGSRANVILIPRRAGGNQQKRQEDG